MKSLMLGAALAALLAGGAAHAQRIRIDGGAFKDSQGRTLILHGVNLAGDSKIPAQPVPTGLAPEASFIGRPFPLSKADENFRRLQSWGFTFERFLVPWEAVEHAGPGQYDLAYLAYLRAIVACADKYGISVFIDFHQDGFSRAEGGDGAPYWALRAVGLLPDRQVEQGAPQTFNGGLLGYWPPTAAAHASNTMSTLFFAGNDYAPGLEVDGKPVQTWLQDHLIATEAVVALALHGLPNVAGYDVYNEPNQGYLGTADLSAQSPYYALIGAYAAPGQPVPSDWDIIQAASGYTPSATSPVTPNALWADGHPDLWRRYGVWNVVNGKPVIEKPGYFASHDGKAPNFDIYLQAFQRRAIQVLRLIDPNAILIQEPNPFTSATAALNVDVPRVVISPHFYDTYSLLTKSFTPYNSVVLFTGQKITGRAALLDYYTAQLKGLAAQSAVLGGGPSLVGEIGVPFDMNNKSSYVTGDFTPQSDQANLLFQALDNNLLSYTIWNYTPDNTNARGDNWLGEDLSIFSLSQVTDPRDINSGGRSLDAILRPYPTATAGTPVSLSFDKDTRIAHYVFAADPSVKAETRIFVPSYQYPAGYKVSISNGSLLAEPGFSGFGVTRTSGEVSVTISPK